MVFWWKQRCGSTRKEDEDKIEIPGVPEGRAAKLADRTKGAVLEAGRYNAEAKISGVYENGTTVTYKITVTNNGTSNLYDLYLQDTLSEELEKALEKKAYLLKKVYIHHRMEEKSELV